MSTAVVIAFGAILAGIALVIIGGAAARVGRGDDDPEATAATAAMDVGELVVRPPSPVALPAPVTGAASAASDAAGTGLAAPARGGGERLRILVIDDEPLVGRVIARLLTGHDTITTTGGEAALAVLAADDRFDVILCDLMMPGLSGTKLAAVIGERHPRMQSRIVFMSSAPDAQRVLYRTPLRWVAKPVRYAQLVLCISDVVAAASPADDAPPAELAVAT